MHPRTVAQQLPSVSKQGLPAEAPEAVEVLIADADNPGPEPDTPDLLVRLVAAFQRAVLSLPERVS
jgi:hypothetical protein